MEMRKFTIKDVDFLISEDDIKVGDLFLDKEVKYIHYLVENDDYDAHDHKLFDIDVIVFNERDFKNNSEMIKYYKIEKILTDNSSVTFYHNKTE